MIIHYLDAVLGEGTPKTTSRGQQYAYQCPICSDYKDRLFVHPDRKVVYCHNCTYANSIITFISDMSNISWHDALRIYREYDGYDIILPDSIQEEIYSRLLSAYVEEIKVPKFVHPLPDEFIAIDELSGRIKDKPLRYLRDRGITMDMATRYHIGFCPSGKYGDRIIMTDFEDHELIYWQARTIHPEPSNKFAKKYFRKVLNPSLTKEQIDQGIKAVDKSDVISNIDLILDNGIAIICEGRMDSYTIGDSGACIHGKHMSDDQFVKLVSNREKIQAVYILLDGDAFKQAVVLADRLYKHFDDVLVCKLEYEQDPNSIGKIGVLKAIREAIPYSPMFPVKAKLKGWV